MYDFNGMLRKLFNSKVRAFLCAGDSVFALQALRFQMDKDLKEKNELDNNAEAADSSKTGEASVSSDTNKISKKDAAKRGFKNPFSGMPKKTLIRIIAIAAAAVVAVVALTLGLVLGLKGGKGLFTVEFKSAEHVKYALNGSDDTFEKAEFKLEEGSEVVFSVILDEGYINPTVRANITTLSAEEGLYRFTVTSNTSVTVSGVVDGSVQLTGDGKTAATPFLIHDLRELQYVTSNINNGNSNYVIAYYSLEADIDCGGAELDVIGNVSNQSAFFGGCFNGNGHSISNYKINSVGYPYAGLFGMVQKYIASSSITPDDSGVIKNLNLKDFAIDAFAPQGGNVIVGSIAGYGIAAKILNCSAVNGTITVVGNTYFCYSGGAVGILQSGINSAMYDNGATYIEPHYAVINSVHTDVDLYMLKGYGYASGGIVSYVLSDHPMAPAYVTNCYSEGNVFNSMRAGGIAGYVGDYGSISNCYSTSEIEANSVANNPIADYDALAGGITAWAGRQSVVSNCFSKATVSAYSVNGTQHAQTGDIVAREQTASLTENGALVYNCFAGNYARPLESTFLMVDLNWSNKDWKIENGSMPVLQSAFSEELKKSYTVSLNYGTETVENKTQKEVELTALGYYNPMIEYLRDDKIEIKDLIVSDGQKTSYGYFFDAEHKLAVPNAYVPINDQILYVGFANYAIVAGTYYNEYGGRVTELLIENGDDVGSYSYTNGGRFLSSYIFDGENILFYDAPFARLSKVISDGDPALNFERYDFVAKLASDGSLSVYDGTYFTEEKPLKFVKNKPVGRDNEFIGDWRKSATVNKVYSFKDGSNWSYSYKGKEKLTGTYTVNNDGVATLVSGGTDYATARIATSGLVEITRNNATEYYGRAEGLLGTWFDTANGDYVMFNGFGAGLEGEALVSIGGNASSLIYIKDGFFDKDSDNFGITLVSPATGALFGYLVYDAENLVLTGALYDGSTGELTQGHSFRLIDNYTGEWIGEGNINGVAFKLLNFNGFGAYGTGYIEINGERTRIEYSADIENGLVGTFNYMGTVYTLNFNDETSVVTVSSASGSTELIRKDELYNTTLISGSTVYEFNGGGHLKDGGVLTVTSNSGVTEYNYKIAKWTLDDKTQAVKEILVNTKNLTSGKNELGTITLSQDGNRFLFKETPTARGASLTVSNGFVGSWAIYSNFQFFTVNSFTLDGASSGYFQGFDATYQTISDTCILVTYYDGLSTAAISAYIVLVDEDTLAISDFTYLVSGRYVYAARRDALYGEWISALDSNSVIRFDGSGFNKFNFGDARANSGARYNYTYRFGKYYMWIRDDDTQMYVINFLGRNPQVKDYYNNGSSNFKLDSFDSAVKPIFEGNDANNVNYVFNIDGTVIVDGAIRSYELVETDEKETTLIIRIDGDEDITAVADHNKGTITIL